ncbi:MAG: anthranilate synthase component I family protein, partial [Acidobacteria bacterium]|nr:anthranilate synthase component I family protein [Acidobacteriota bacterium]
PYALSLRHGELGIVSNSPELLLAVANGIAESRPIKGTIARGLTEVSDAVQRALLLASAKDAAEHVMIVDLVRNDLGKVAEPGGVDVPELLALRTYRHLHHLESTVRARLAPHSKLSDVLLAVLPGGSITGAPKRSALGFIRALEPSPRGPYTGAVGLVRGDGTAIFNVPIRTAIVSPAGVDYHSGGGIVWDSEARSEWLETETKSREFERVMAGESG